MRTPKGAFLTLLIASAVAIVGVLPQVTEAMPPPGSIRAWLLAMNQVKIDGISVFFHNPEDLTNCPVGGGSCFQRLTFGTPAASVGIRVYSSANPVYSGQSVAVTAVLWLSDGAAPLIDLNGTRNDANQMWQTIPYPVGHPESPWLSRQQNEIHYPDTLTSFSETSNYYILSGQRVSNRYDRPDVIQSVVYNAPEVTAPTTFATYAQYYYSADAAAPVLVDGTPEAFLAVNPRQQKVEVSGGPAVVDQLSSASRLVPTDVRGQTIITQNAVLACSWVVADIQSDCTANPPTTIGLYTRASTTRNQAWETLTRTMSKLAQERGSFLNSNDNTQITNGIKSFLERPASIWKASRGEVLFVTTSADVVIDPSTNITVNGKKIVVFTNASSVTWAKNVTVPTGKADSSFYKFATVMFANGGNVTLTGDSYNGAFLSKGDVTIGGSGSTATIKGLIVANGALNITRAVDPATNRVIARITYDPSFQNGTVVGLSPFVLPLVSEGADR